MADMSALTLPHGTIPTQMFGNVNLQNAVMFINENFKELLSGVNANTEAATELLAGKAESGHNHDDAYAAYGHIHSWQDISGLQSMLDGKADLNHEHSQYLSSLPAHYHDINSVQGLGETLQGKAEKTHGHTIAQIENLATELGVKASISYVDQQIGNISGSLGESTKTIIEGYASDKTDVTKTPKDAVIRPIGETDAQKKARIGTSVHYAREDHQHVLDTETSDITKLKHDGNGDGGAASFGTGTNVPRIDHSHPLNYPTGKPTSSIAQDGMGYGGTALFGSTNCYADLGHSHPLNVATSGTPEDVVKSTGSALLGNDETYARTDHVHKMPALSATDISYTTDYNVGTKLDDHETRIVKLEKYMPEPGPVGSHSHGDITNDGKIVNSSGKFIVGGSNTKLTTSDLEAPTGLTDVNMVKAIAKLFDYASASNTFTLSTSKLRYPIGEGKHQYNCFLTVNASGEVVHGGNEQYDKLTSVWGAFDYEGNAGEHYTNAKLPVGKIHNNFTTQHRVSLIGFSANEVGADQSATLLDGLPSEAVSLGNDALHNPHYLNEYVTANGVDVGAISGVTSGYLKGNGSDRITTASTIPDDDIDYGTATNITDANIGNYAVSSVNDKTGDVTVTEFPGFGGTGNATTASHSDHTHTEYAPASAAFPGFADNFESGKASRGNHMHGYIDSLGALKKMSGTSLVNANDAVVGTSSSGYIGHIDGVLATGLKAVYSAFSITGSTTKTAKLPTAKVDYGSEVTNITSGNLDLQATSAGFLKKSNADTYYAVKNTETVASNAATAASNAQTTANNASTKADSAQSTANTASSKADAAQSSVASLSTTVSALSSEVSVISRNVETLAGTVAGLSDDVSAIDARVSTIESDYATKSWVESQGYITEAELGETYATKSWVESQGYVTDAELENYITKDEIPQTFITAIASASRTTGNFTFITDIQFDGTSLQCKTRKVTVDQGLITTIGNESDWSTWHTPTVITWS